jgi:hypothetical protein
LPSFFSPELNDMTKKLQKEVDRLKEQLQRRRWPMPFGDSWDSDSMYNFLTGSSYSDDQDSDTSSRDYHSSRVNNNPPSTTLVWSILQTVQVHHFL